MEKADNVKEIQALLNLLDDPDKEVFNEVTKKIFLYGSQIIPHLESAWENTMEPETQKRIENLIHQIQLKDLRAELEQWKRQDEKDLLAGWILVSKYYYPELNEDKIKLEINRIRKDIWLEINDDLTAPEQIKVFNHFFYDVFGFTGDLDSYNDPHNCYINKILETRKGNPLSLGMLYLIIAESLDMPVRGVDLPEHFVLAYTAKALNPDDLDKENINVLFYINAFSKGNIFSQQEAEWFLQQLSLESDPDNLRICSKSEIMSRLLMDLITSYEKTNELAKAKELKSLYDIVTD